MSELDNYHIPLTMLFAGDSITMLSDKSDHNGFSTRIRDYYEGKITLYNLGMSGAQTMNSLDFVNYSTFPESIPKAYDAVFLMLGTNDCGTFYIGTIDPDDYAENLVGMFNRLKESADNVVLIKPPPMKGGNNYPSPTYVNEFCDKVQEVADKYGLDVLDIRSRI